MQCRFDRVIYENKEYNALQILKKLKLSTKLYYKKRNLGFSAQQAFDHCLELKIKQRERINVAKEARENNISRRIIHKGIRDGKSLDCITKEQAEKKQINLQNVTYLHEIGLPLEYDSLTSFCISEGLNMPRVYYNLQKGMNLYEAVSFSLVIKAERKKHNYFNIQLTSLAQKFGLDYNQLIRWLRNGCNYLEAIEREVFARIFSSNMGGRYNYLWNMYKNEFLKGINIQDKIKENEFQNFLLIYSRMEYIKKNLAYYAFLESVNISAYKMLSLDDRVQNALLANTISSFSLNELYYILDFEQGLMKDFTFLEEKQVWVYNGNREILKRLKKPSN